MDTLSHGLWGSLAFGRKNKKSFRLAFFFGMAPDLFSFGPFFAAAAFGLAQRPPISGTPPLESAIPGYVHILYRPTHSLIIFAAAFLIIWAIRKKPWACPHTLFRREIAKFRARRSGGAEGVSVDTPSASRWASQPELCDCSRIRGVRTGPVWEMSAWALHVLYDTPLHTEHFFPTPFLWPVSSYTVSGWNWGNPWIFFPNVILLALGFAAFFWYRRRRRYG